MSVLKKYNLEFVNKPFTYFDNETINRKIAVHNISNDFLGYFLHKFIDVGDIDEIINDVNFIISEGSYDPEYCLDIGLDSLYMEYTNISVKFYDKFQGEFIQEIPFIDFIEILLLWKTFVQTPPLNNQTI